MAKQIKNPKRIQRKARKNVAVRTGDTMFRVTSASSGSQYRVHMTPNGCTCNCKWGQYRSAMDKRSGCSHVVAAYDLVAEEAGQQRNVSVWTNEGDARRQHRPLQEIAEGVILTAVQAGPIRST